eukprot:CAMPEP_0113714944 /NCGR_PEP_ID=MMETSP0038_2-20120614/32943_1 /TAXON_ID=2898 /ORGANISM="Cryptomonas paramecium" /LENGTH=104 /DNA_ID=CAMNT_0000642067 /DNA_START=74 /DNA_END=390 /DNA_ORIENTATION=+ /assembly_acc=CAM_ASM_000170
MSSNGCPIKASALLPAGMSWSALLGESLVTSRMLSASDRPVLDELFASGDQAAEAGKDAEMPPQGLQEPTSPAATSSLSDVAHRLVGDSEHAANVGGRQSVGAQ